MSEEKEIQTSEAVETVEEVKVEETAEVVETAEENVEVQQLDRKSVV